MNPMTIASIVSALAGLGSLWKGQTEQIPKLDPDFWKAYWDPSRVQMITGPIKEQLRGREAERMASSGERWGSSGLVSGAGHRAEKRTISRDTESILAGVLSQARAGEMTRATNIGLAQFQSELGAALEKRAGWSKLGETLMTPGAMMLGAKLGGKVPTETIPPTGQGDTVSSIAKILSEGIPWYMQPEAYTQTQPI